MEGMDSWVTDSLPSFAKNLHILLVDYDLVSLQHLASLLHQQSYNVATTQLASVALSMIEEKGGRFDLVMANASMPDMDSFLFLRVLLKRNIAVILMSEGVNLNVAAKALAEGACYFLQKPVSKDDLKYVWQHVYRKNRSIIKQTQIASYIENAKPGNGSVGINIADNVVLSRRAAVDSYNNGINYQPMIYTKKDKHKQIESANGLVGSNCGGKRSINDIEGTSKEKRVKYNSLPAHFGSIIDEDHEKRKEYYISNVSRTRVVWNAERRRKFTDALNKLGDKTRPKLILKMMNEPCLTLRQVANHLQLARFPDTAIPKYKAQVECIKKKRENKLPPRQVLKSNASARAQFPPLFGKQQHEMRKFGKGGLSSVTGGDRFRLIAPRALPNPRLPVSDFVNHGLRILNHNFQHVGLNHNSVSHSLDIDREVGIWPDNVQATRKECGIFPTDSRGNFGIDGRGVRISEFNLPNVSNVTQELASSDTVDDYQLPDDVLNIIQQIDLADFDFEDQELQHNGARTTDDSQFMSGEIALPTSAHSDSTAAYVTNGSYEMDAGSTNEVSLSSSAYTEILNILEEDPNSYDSDINLADVDKYCEWLRNTVLENKTDPESFISDDAENVPIKNTQ